MTELIVFAKNGKVICFDCCKIVIDIPKKCLFVTPTTNNENLTQIAPNFHQNNFYRHNNILFTVVSVVGEESVNNNFALIFFDALKSKKVLDVIQKNIKAYKSSVLSLQEENSENIFKTLFIKPILNEIKLNEAAKNTHFLMKFLKKFLESLSPNEIEDYKIILMEAKMEALFLR